MRALLDNVNFARCLERKKDWRFQKIEILLAVVMSGHWFKQTAEAVRLDESIDVNTALKALSLCRQIKTLDLRCRWRKAHLTLIGRNFPNLEQLNLYGIDEYLGSLAELKTLRRLAIKSYDPSEGKWAALTPLGSVSTLRSLNCQETGSLPSSLDNFRNLAHLRCAQLTEKIVTQLRNLANIKLHSLAVDVYYREDIKYFRHLWDAGCLRDLKHLRLRILCEKEEESGEESQEEEVSGVSITELMSRFVINSELPNLTTLEHLSLEGGFDLAWGPRLAALKNLKRLQLTIHNDDVGCTIGGHFFHHSTFLELQGLMPCYDAWRNPEELTAILKKEFDSAPTIRVSLLETWDHSVDDETQLEEFSSLCGDHM